MECTYTNAPQRGALAIEKDSTKGGAVSTAGAVFSYDGDTVEDNGADGVDEDPAIGRVCVSGLATGDYTVNEDSPPPGYGDAPADEEDQTVTVVTGTDCDENPPGQTPRRRSRTRRSRTSRSTSATAARKRRA